jgi:hypothetical protein
VLDAGRDTHHLLNAKCKYSGEPVAQSANKIEESVSFLHVVASVVSGEKIDTSCRESAPYQLVDPWHIRTDLESNLPRRNLRLGAEGSEQPSR